MKRKFLQAFFLSLCVTTSCYAAQPFARKAESSASESAGPDGTIRAVVSTSFAFANIYNAKSQKFTDVLISQKIESSTHSGAEGADSTLEVIAWVTGKTKYDTKLWTIKEGADAGEKWFDFYRTTKFGSCGSEDLHRVFNFKDGQYAFSFTVEPASVDLPNTSIKRYISYVSANAAGTGCERTELPSNGIGAITISDGSSQKDRILLESDDRELAWSPTILLTDKNESKGTSSLSLWQANGLEKAESITGFAVKVHFYDGMEAIVPVNGDKFDIQKASLPKTVKIQRIPIEQSELKKK